MSSRRAPLACLFALLAASPLSAQDPPPAATATAYLHTRDAAEAFATRITTVIRIDGLLDESAWSAATPITRFTQLDPNEGAPVSERTEIRILYDDVALYIGAMLYDRSPVTARVGRRDMTMTASDWLTVIVDSRHDHRTAFGFEVNPAGVRRDQTRAGGQEDDSWDPVWEVATSVTDSGWIAELRIPFSQLRFSGAPLLTWGLQIERQIARNQEFAVWSFTPRDQPGGIPRFGHLTALRSVAAGKRLEVLPFVMARSEHIDRGANPFRSGSEQTADAGADLKYRVTTSLTLDATVNPDFGQVEVDPSIVNLTAFETFLPERRPFFVEGSEMFRFGQDGTNSVFYSRRIGRRPSLVPQHSVRDVPSATRILGAAKLTGRTTGGWSIGVLDAVTARETARFRTVDGMEGRMTAEPLTNYLVGRARREARTGQTALGGLIGAVNRDLETPELRGALRSAAYSGGVDWFHQWSGRTMTLQGFLGGSHVRGDSTVMAATQRLPYHYFQRPDADHLDYETGRTALSGFAGNVQLGRRVGRLWNYSGTVNTVSPGYEVSDLGFQRRADRIDFQANLNYNESRPRGIARRHGAYVQGLMEHNYGWENVSNRLFTGGWIQFMNYWVTEINANVSLPGTVDDRLTRGGPAAYRPGSAAVNLWLGSDQRRTIVGSFGSFLRTGGNGHEVSLFPQIALRPAPHWELSVGPAFSRIYDEAQYVRRVRDATATHTYGDWYVFADVRQNILSVQTRLNYTFTPNLSLQVYAQPFIFSAQYGPRKEFAEPNSYDFLVYGEDVGEIVDGMIYPRGRDGGGAAFADIDPDFNVRELRGNAVLRWEWRPGSTIFVAWQQMRDNSCPTQRPGECAIGGFDLGRDTGRLFRTSPDDVLLVKMSWWFNP